MPPSSGGSNPGLIIALVVAVVAVLGVGGFFLLSGDDDDPETAAGMDSDSDEEGSDEESGASGSPEDALRGWMQAILDEDCDAMYDHMIEDNWSAAGSRDAALQDCEQNIGDTATEVETIDVQSIEVFDDQGDLVVLEIVSMRLGSETVEQVDLHLEDGEWRLDFDSFVEL